MQLQVPVGKQARFIVEPPSRINLLYGSWRSGKTVGCNLKWVKDVALLPEGNMLMVGTTINALERNVLTGIKRLVGDNNYALKRQSKVLNVLDREIWIEGADKADSYKRIEGETLLAAYVDEGLRMDKKFMQTLLSRLSEPEARLYITCNPGPPTHYLYTDYIQREAELDMRVWKFGLDDNPWLSDEYKANLVAENPPGTVFYRRNVMGDWVSGSGLVYGNFDRARHVVDAPPHGLTPRELRIGVDYGTHSPTCYLMVEKYLVPGRLHPTWYVTNEYYWDSEIMAYQKTDSEYSEDMAAFLAGRWVAPPRMVAPSGLPEAKPEVPAQRSVPTVHTDSDCAPQLNGAHSAQRSVPTDGVVCATRPSAALGPASALEPRRVYPASIEVDPSAASFVLQLQRDGMKRAVAADNVVLDGIRVTASMISAGDLVVCRSCPWLIQSIESYEWKPDSNQDEIVKENDHCVDALRYFVNSIT